MTNSGWISRGALLLALGIAFAASQDASGQLLRRKNRLDKSDAKATSVAPESTQVEVIRLDYDPDLPQFIVVVESFDYSASGQTSGGGQAAPLGAAGVSGQTYTVTADGGYRVAWSSSYAPQIGQGIAKQLTSALNGWPNITLIEPDAIKNNGDGTYTLKLQPNEVGPFIVRGTITEFSETAEAESSNRGLSSRKLGRSIRSIGWLSGSRGLAKTGSGISAAGPEIQSQEMKRTGMVGMDIRVIDGRSARIAPGGAFSSQGSFTSMSVGSNFEMLGFSSGGEASASSSLGQATRAAMNDALLKVRDALRNAHRSRR